MPEIMLSTQGVVMKFGGLTAVSDLNIEIGKNEIVGLIGPNGAGKTTAFNVITGMYSPTSGAVRYRTKDITGHKPHSITELGIARTFQNIRLFKELTVLENVLVGCHIASATGSLALRTTSPHTGRGKPSPNVRDGTSFAVGLVWGGRRKGDEPAVRKTAELEIVRAPRDQADDLAFWMSPPRA